MIVDVPTEIIPIWFIERWKKENAESGSALDMFIEQMIKDWQLEEIRQSKTVMYIHTDKVAQKEMYKHQIMRGD